MKLLILAGGTGTRLWPLSRIYNPKQFVKLVGDEYSLFQRTVQNAISYFKREDIYIVSNEEYKYFVLGQLKEIAADIDNSHIILEPEFANTFMAVAVGVYTILRACPEDSDILVVPVNAIIGDNKRMFPLEELRLEKANLVENYMLYGVAVSDDYHSTYGYISVEVESMKASYLHVECLKRQEADRQFLAVIGLFSLSTQCFMKDMQTLYPELDVALKQEDIKRAYSLGIRNNIEDALFGKVEHLQGMQLSKNVVTEYGLLRVLKRYSENADENKNININNSLYSLDSKNNLIYTEHNKTVGLLEVEDIVVIDQHDALLICKRSRVNDVHLVVNMISEAGDERAKYHTTVYRPWGSYKNLENGDCGEVKYQVKRIVVLPSEQISLQLHHHRSEHWIVIKGTATVQKGNMVVDIHQGESIYINKEEKHRLTNNTEEIVEIIEVQMGDIISETDIERFDDVYGRVK